MAATYAREITSQDCSNKQHVAFHKGARAGCLEVTADAPWSAGCVNVRCTKTGNEFTIADSGFYRHRAKDLTGCRFCSPRPRAVKTGVFDNGTRPVSSRRKIAFVKGEMYGHLEVIESFKYCSTIPVRCTTTGKEIVVSGTTLYSNRDTPTRLCPACDTRRKDWSNTGHSKLKNCRACDDCPALRPVNGVCPACGEPGNCRS